MEETTEAKIRKRKIREYKSSYNLLIDHTSFTLLYSSKNSFQAEREF